MKQIISSVWIALFMFLALSGCQSEEKPKDNSPVVANFKDKKLTNGELEHFIPEGLTQKDSARFADYFIDQWLKNQAICEVALQEDKNLAATIDFKVNDYRQKLIVHEYTSKLIRDSLDIDIPDTDIQLYYSDNKGDFVSKENYYCYFYIVTANTDVSQAKKWMEKNDKASYDQLSDWAKTNALKYKLDSVFLGNSEINEVSVGYFGNLKNARLGKLISWTGVIQGQRRKYLFKLLKTIKPGEFLPVSLTRNKIMSDLLNERKIRLIERMEERIFQNAKMNNYISN